MALEAVVNPSVTYQGSPSETKKAKSDEKKAKNNIIEAKTHDAKKDGVISKETGIEKDVKNDIAKLPRGTEAMKKAVEEINKNAKNSEAIFGIHDATNRVTIKIVDKDTKKVIKEYPPEKTLDMIAKVWEMAGLMVDEKR